LKQNYLPVSFCLSAFSVSPFLFQNFVFVFLHGSVLLTAISYYSVHVPGNNYQKLPITDKDLINVWTQTDECKCKHFSAIEPVRRCYINRSCWRVYTSIIKCLLAREDFFKIFANIYRTCTYAHQLPHQAKPIWSI
jgi:hypothetical protein